MSISVREAMQLKQFQQIQLVTGKSGLDNIIERIGILDFEIVEGIEGEFFQGDFVLTTFTAARDDINKVASCIKALIACKVSALAIKTIYYDKLPLEVLDLAEASKLPIFMFDEHVFFEYIIEDLMEGMHARSHMALLSSKVDILFKNDLKKSIVREVAREINRAFLDNHCVIYMKENVYTTEENTMKLAERFQRSRLKSGHHSLIQYGEGMILFLTYQKCHEQDIILDLDHVKHQLGISDKDFVFGKSNIRDSLDGMDMSIREAIYASEACEILSKTAIWYQDIGIYKILLPYSNDLWLRNFSEAILDPIRQYDQGKLLETAKIYIECDGDVKATSERMYQHINTIRYRIHKMQEIMNENHHGRFYEQLSVAVKCDRIIRRRV